MSGSEREVYEVLGAPRNAGIGCEEPCAVCAGSGHAAGTGVQMCRTCVGRGTLRVSAGLGGGRWLQVEPCGTCGGDGKVALPCRACDGLGTTVRERRIAVRLAPQLPVRSSESGLIRVAAAVLLALGLVFLVFLLQVA